MPLDPLAPVGRAARPFLLAAALALLAGACAQGSPQLTAPAEIASSSSSDAASASTTAVLAPDLRVTLFDGEDFDLAEHLSRDGRPVVLYLWSTTCPACLEQLPDFDEAARRHPEVLFLGIAVGDDPAAAEAAADDNTVACALGADVDGSVAANFPSTGLPVTFLIGSDGTLLGAVYDELEPEGLEDLISRHLAG